MTTKKIVTKSVVTSVPIPVQVTVYSEEDLVKMIEQAVADKPDGYTYQSEFGKQCSNFAPTLDDIAKFGHVSKKVPACIIGNVLSRLGFTEHDMGSTTGISGALDSILNKRPDVEFTPKFLYFGKIAQATQDKGATWESVLEAVVAARQGFNSVFNSVRDEYAAAEAVAAKF